MTTRSPDSISQDIHNKAEQTAERSIYSLSNLYTTNDEKVEIEFWYQLPFDEQSERDDCSHNGKNTEASNIKN